MFKPGISAVQWKAPRRKRAFLKAGMAELADAADSKSADLRVLGVRLPLPAPNKTPQVFKRLLRLDLVCRPFLCHSDRREESARSNVQNRKRGCLGGSNLTPKDSECIRPVTTVTCEQFINRAGFPFNIQFEYEIPVEEYTAAQVSFPRLLREGEPPRRLQSA